MLNTFKRPSLLILTLSTATTWIVGLLAPNSAAALAVGFCWIAFGVYVLYRLIRSGHFWIAALPVFFVIAISIGISLPSDTLHGLLDPADRLLAKLKSPLPAGKYGHVFCFAMLTLFALAIRRKLEVSAKELVLFICLMAVATEGFQLFLPERTTQIFDLVLDLLGALIGFGIFYIYKQVYPNRVRSKDVQENSADENSGPT